jgi:hypothetical protein
VDISIECGVERKKKLQRTCVAWTGRRKENWTGVGTVFGLVCGTELSCSISISSVVYTLSRDTIACGNIGSVFTKCVTFEVEFIVIIICFVRHIRVAFLFGQ